MNSNIPTPSSNEIERYFKYWETLEHYVLQEGSLNKLFGETYPNNTDINDILIKVSSLNDFYSTNIYSVFPVAKRILELDVDNRLKQGDESLVNDIAPISISGKDKYFYSFATKYCSHHNPIHFPIYDYYVEKVLMYFKKKDKFSEYRKTELKDYKVFKKVLLEFREYYGLAKYSLKEIDLYLWQAGKEYFPKRYK